jgi:DNA-binding GntR family transcriptional regulator
MLNVPDTRLALQAYDRILGMIMSGEARPGDLINERQLGHALHMSRTPVRDALLMLEREGLLVRQGTRGLQIKQMRIEDFMNALQIRLLLEPEAARIAAGRVPTEARAEIEARLRALLAQAEKGGRSVDREEVRGVDNRLHGLVAEAGGNEQMAAIILTLRRQTQIFDLKSLPERLHDTCREHLAIVGALGMQDGTEAAEAMKAHLEQVRQSIITRLARM